MTRKITERYEEYYEKYRSQIIDDMLNQYINSNTFLLDAGCGFGTRTNKYAPYVSEYFGVDVSLEELKIANKRNTHKNASFINSDLEYLPFKSKTFDTIICFYVVEHLELPLSVFKEFNRVLIDNGVLLIITPNALSLFGLISKFFIPFSLQKKIEKRLGHTMSFPTFYRANTVSKLDNLLRLRKNNLKRIQLEMVHHFLFYKPMPLLVIGIILKKVTDWTVFCRFKNCIYAIYQKQEI